MIVHPLTKILSMTTTTMMTMMTMMAMLLLSAIMGLMTVKTASAFVIVDTTPHYPQRRTTVITRTMTATSYDVDNVDDIATVASGTTTTNTATSASTTKSQSQSHLVIVPPNRGFRDTSDGEVSIASMNLLAPFYNSLGLDPKNTSDYERWEFLHRDRTERVPEAIKMAKRSNADILCLQEIEGGRLAAAETTTEGDSDGDGDGVGGGFTLRDEIREWLAQPTEIGEGYDSFVWSALNPNNKRGDVVGLCVAWRSKKHSLVEWEGYKRGMVCQFHENSESSSSSFAVANLHLPARPSNVLGRLHAMSRTIRKLTQLDQNRVNQNRNRRSSFKTINGLIVVAGDFNSDQNSVAARLLTHGYTNYGNVKDRNYKAKITKAKATDMNHPYRFIDSYENGGGDFHNDPRLKDNTVRELYAPVTVSLKGRGPGIMDHMFYATASSKNGGKQHRRINTSSKPVNEKKYNQQLQSTKSTTTKAGELAIKPSSTSILYDHLSSGTGGKRRLRRKKAESRGGGGGSGSGGAARSNNDPTIRIDSILATIDGNNDEVDKGDERLRIIHEGLPNLEEGFPSDHLPVGALFSVSAVSTTKYNNEEEAENDLSSSEDEKSRTAILSETVEAPDSSQDGTAPAAAVMNYHNGRATNTTRGGGGTTSNVIRRRENSRASFGLRRRHNLVLNAITEWMVGLGAASVVLDKPLYKNELLSRTMGGAKNLQQKIKRKSRAPDLMCILAENSNSNNDDDPDDDKAGDGGGVLVVVEVAVATNPEKVREQKNSKYQDLVTAVTNHGKTSNKCHLGAIIVRDDGVIPEETRADIKALAQLSFSSTIASSTIIEAEAERFCSHLQSLVSSLRLQEGGGNK
jgi:mRNA deadenylase 3'-5' endonuclease subunit Ccr4